MEGKMIYKNFNTEKSPIVKDNSIVLIGNDGTCIKKVDLPKCFERLETEAKCLKILNGNIAPKLIEYDREEHAIRMEYINGYTLPEYVKKYGEMPKFFYAKLVGNLFELLDNGIEYGEIENSMNIL